MEENVLLPFHMKMFLALKLDVLKRDNMLICSPLSALEVEAFYSSYRQITSNDNRIGPSYRIIR